jgi:DNA topoisomerase-1
MSDESPGLRRTRAGRGFRYWNVHDKPIRDRVTLERIRKLAIPPAWSDVWICPDPRGHIQATGRDARRRKQYRYHERWSEVRQERKFDHLVALARVLPAIRRRVRQDLAREGLPKEKIVALVVRLLDETGMRVGNEEYARTNRSFGLTTLRNKHVEVSGSRIAFEFRGKSGKLYKCELRDPRLSRIIARCQAIPGHELFQYIDDEGHHQPIDSADVNDYLRAAAGDEFTAKDMRTWAGTLLAVAALRRSKPARTAMRRKALVLAAIDEVAARLNNTRAVCRDYYVHPAVVAAFEKGTLARVFSARKRRNAARGLTAEERMLVDFLASSSGSAVTANGVSTRGSAARGASTNQRASTPDTRRGDAARSYNARRRGKAKTRSRR